MITIALFNNKGGVGKTTLVYHLAHMFSRIGYPNSLTPRSSSQSNFSLFR